MDLCDITAYDGIQGKSLSPILQDARTSVRESILVEDDVPMITAKLTPIPARTRTILADDYRYTRNSKGEEQLFKLSEDPDEMHDCKAEDPARTRMLEAMADALMHFAWCSFPDPHHPMTPPGKWFDMYNPADMSLPDSRTDPLVGAPAHLNLFAAIHPKDQRNWVAPCGYGNDELLGEAIAATYGMISMIDHGIGRILAHLEKLGVRDNTIVVFTSDHGDMMGEHSLFLKGFMHYRGTLQVPMVIDLPGAASGRTSSPWSFG